ncbi:MAG: tetratricopeptide repeat protein [Flammeovirgaceae bacterium]|nr:tetratricopeptide repeat protein [Flammeovirgaceae bacterium]
MYKSQYIVISVAIIMIIGLALLPRVVVDNDKILSEEQVSGEAHSDPDNEEGILAEDYEKISKSIQSFYGSKSKEEKASILEEIIGEFKAINRYDSAAVYAEYFAIEYPEDNNFQKAGEIYFEAFTFAFDSEKKKRLAVKTREIFQRVLDNNPGLLDLKTKIGLTYMSSENPMQGIMMIRAVLEQDPDNELAISNMGVLAMQSGQYNKALARFQKLIELNPQDMQARFYLGVCYKELGEKEKAREILNLVKSQESNPDVLSMVDKVLSEID